MLIFRNFIIIVCVFLCFGLFGKDDDEEKILRVAKQLSSFDLENFSIKQLSGGLTNNNYKVTSGSIDYFFRSANSIYSPLGNSLDREWQITKSVSKSSIAPKVILYVPEEGVLVTDFIHSKSEKIDLHNPTYLHRFSRLISSLHKLEVEFPTEFDPFENLKDYLRSIHELNIILPEDFANLILPKILLIKRTLPNLYKTSKAPTHLDLHAGNLLDDGKKLWLIDWEYAAMADPFFDLATLASVENFSDFEMNEFLACYLENVPSKEQIEHFYAMRILADIRWGLWCYLQDKISPIDEPFVKMGNEYFQHALERISASVPYNLP